jgi:hypothetical protein
MVQANKLNPAERYAPGDFFVMPKTQQNEVEENQEALGMLESDIFE